MKKLIVCTLSFFGAYALAVGYFHVSNTTGLVCGVVAVILGMGLSGK